jgi:hypothetical protein
MNAVDSAASPAALRGFVAPLRQGFAGKHPRWRRGNLLDDKGNREPDLHGALAQGNSAIATARLTLLDNRLAARPDAGSEASLALQARGSILVITEALIEHASYFDAGAPV